MSRATNALVCEDRRLVLGLYAFGQVEDVCSESELAAEPRRPERTDQGLTVDGRAYRTGGILRAVSTGNALARVCVEIEERVEVPSAPLRAVERLDKDCLL